MTQEAKFKYTFPISKAEQRADGYYITGYASGPEVDSEGERMAPEAIARFAQQINDDTVDRLVYRDAHAPDGVLRDLGEITKAWVESNFHLGIEVKLDDDNPSSMYLFRQLKKGKQYGMSVAGHVVDYAIEFAEEIGKSVLTYKNVVLDEISNTTRPAWYPSFGTVLSKSIKDASIDAPAGVTVDENELLDAAVEDATKSDEAVASEDETTEKAVEATDEVVEKRSDAAQDAASASYIVASLINLLGDETDDPEEAAVLRQAITFVQQYVDMEIAEIGTPEDQADSSEGMWSESDKEDSEAVAKAGRKLSNATSTRLLELYNEMASTLTDLGVIEVPEVEIEDSEKSASEAEEDTVEKTEGVEATAETVSKSELDALAAALAKATERIAELEARPATALPGVITDATKKAAEEELAETFAKASPSDKMRLAFAAHTSGK
jgi:phage head maturation protease